MTINYDPFYPDSYHRHDQIQAYLDKQQAKILEILNDTERNIDTKSYEGFVRDIKELLK